MRSFHVLSLSALIAFAIGCGGVANGPSYNASSVDALSQTFQTNGAPMVLVENFRGRISVQGGSDSALRAEVTRIAHGETQQLSDAFRDAVEVSMSQQGNIIRLSAKSSRPESELGTNTAELVLTVPSHADLSLRTGIGDINVMGILSSVVANAVEGDIQIMGGQGAISANTGVGSIALVPSGPVLVTALTGSGHISFVGSLTDGTSTFQALNGDVALVLPQTASFVVDASTHNGRVTSDFEVRDEVAADETLRGQVGEESGAVVEVRSGNGSIHLGTDARSPNASLTAGR